MFVAEYTDDGAGSCFTCDEGATDDATDSCFMSDDGAMEAGPAVPFLADDTSDAAPAGLTEDTTLSGSRLIDDAEWAWCADPLSEVGAMEKVPVALAGGRFGSEGGYEFAADGCGNGEMECADTAEVGTALRTSERAGSCVEWC